MGSTLVQYMILTSAVTHEETRVTVYGEGKVFDRRPENHVKLNTGRVDQYDYYSLNLQQSLR